MAKVLGCKVGKLPIKYLGMTLEAKYKDVRMWNLILVRFERRLARWKRNFLSKKGCLTLIKSILSNLLVYYMSLLIISVSVVRKLKAIQCIFLWDD